MPRAIDRTSAQNAPARAQGGIPLGTRVITMAGEMPVEFLCPGDRIVTRTGARKLAAVEAHVVRNARMVHIPAGTLGFDRPCDETMVPADQPILIRDWRAKALFGAAQVLVPAGRLADGQLIRKERIAEVRLFILSFDEDEVIYAGGLELACQSARIDA